MLKTATLMKRLLFVLFCLFLCCYSSLAYKHRNMGIYQTNDGQVFSIGVPFTYPLPNGERDSYDLDIHMTYRSLHYQNENASFDVIIKESLIPGFKRDLIAIRDKCIEWGKIAKSNGVSSYRKELPISVRYSNMHCLDSYSPSETEVICSFCYSDGIPKCELHFIMRVRGGYEMSAYSAYIVLDMDEINELVGDINPVLNDIRQNDRKRGSIDKLFQ